MMDPHSLPAHLLHQYGYAGLGVALALNCMGIPISAEVLLPLTGALIRTGGLNLVWVCVVAILAQIFGLLMAYLVGRHGGEPLLERYGHLVFLNHARLRKLHKLFKRHGFRIVFTGLYLPGVHGYMGYVAGLGKMRLPLFALLLVTSNIIWTLGLVGIGMLLSNHLGDITRAMNGIGLVVVVAVLLGAAGVWYSKQRAR